MRDKKNDPKLIEGKDKDGNTVKVMLKPPGAVEYRDSQVEYNRAFRKALDSGALLRQKLSDHMEQQGLWDDEKQKQNDQFIKDINKQEEILKIGGIRLSEAKETAMGLRRLRAEFREFLAERNSLDQNSAEGQADNARFSELVRLCMLNPSSKQPYFPSQKDYDEAGDQPWVIEAAGDLAGMIYGLDPNYDNKLEENKFLQEFDFCNKDLRLVNEEGHLVDGEGRLLSEDGRYVAYRTEEGRTKQDEEDRFFINRDGDEVVEIVDEDGTSKWEKPSLSERKPFLDDDDKPIEAKTAEESADEPPEAEAEVKEEKKPKRRKKSTEVETDADAS